MEFKKLIEEQNRLECLKTRGELTDYGLEMLEELSQALQSLQSCVSSQVDETETQKIKPDLNPYSPTANWIKPKP